MKKKSFFSKIATTLIHKLKREIIEDLFKIYIFSSEEKEKNSQLFPIQTLFQFSSHRFLHLSFASC